jgi:hypothetical protein
MIVKTEGAGKTSRRAQTKRDEREGETGEEQEMDRMRVSEFIEANITKASSRDLRKQSTRKSFSKTKSSKEQEEIRNRAERRPRE